MPNYGDKHDANDGTGVYFYTGEGEHDGWEFKSTVDLVDAGGEESYLSTLKEPKVMYEHDNLRLTYSPTEEVYRFYKNNDDRWHFVTTIAAGDSMVMELFAAALDELAVVKAENEALKEKP
jgi:hypothetical protein